MTAADSRFEESMGPATVGRSTRRERRLGPDDDVEVLVTAAAGGDVRAYEALVQRYSGLVWATSRAYGLAADDAADVSQFVWVRLVQNLGRINEPAKLGGWLCTVALTECFRIMRNAGREVVVVDRVVVDRVVVDRVVVDRVVVDRVGVEAARGGSECPALSEPELTDGYARVRILLEERNAELWRAVDGLPCQCSSLIRSLFSESRASYQAIAERLNIPVGSIGPTRQRCLERLRRSSAFRGITDQSDDVFTGDKGVSA